MPSVEEALEWDRNFRQSFEREETAFQQLTQHQLISFKGQFVAISGGKIIDQDRDEISLARRVSRLPKEKFILIEHV